MVSVVVVQHVSLCSIIIIIITPSVPTSIVITSFHRAEWSTIFRRPLPPKSLFVPRTTWWCTISDGNQSTTLRPTFGSDGFFCLFVCFFFFRRRLFCSVFFSDPATDLMPVPVDRAAVSEQRGLRRCRRRTSMFCHAP